MFNKIQPQQNDKNIVNITEMMSQYDVRYPIPGSDNKTGSILAIDCEMVECENEIGASV